MDLSDDKNSLQQIIGRVKSGDRDAFRLVVRQNAPMLRSYLVSHLRHMDDVDDLAQDVFLVAFQKLDQFEQGDFGAWLREIARYRLLMHYRTSARRESAVERFREQFTQTIQQDLGNAVARQTPEMIEKLLDCMGRLPDRMRQVVQHGLDGVNAAVLAEKMNTTVGAVYNLQYRANTRLRDCMKSEAD